MEILISVAGAIFGAAGLITGYFQNKQKIQFQKVVRANNWYNFQRANNASGILQNAISLYTKEHEQDINPKVLAQLSKADAFSQEVYKESIRQIHFTEPSFTKHDIETWLKDGKIGELDKKFFSWLADSKPEDA